MVNAIPLAVFAQVQFNPLQTGSHCNPSNCSCSTCPYGECRYELCNQYGIYLMDEANVETHGFEPTFRKKNAHPACWPEWHDAIVDRGVRMVSPPALSGSTPPPPPPPHPPTGVMAVYALITCMQATTWGGLHCPWPCWWLRNS